jgi:hypothetical protein
LSDQREAESIKMSLKAIPVAGTIENNPGAGALFAITTVDALFALAPVTDREKE